MLLAIRLITCFLTLEAKDSIYLEWQFRDFFSFDFRFLLVIDFLRIFFLVTVILISFSVLVFRKSYIQNELFTVRFYLVLLVFITRIMLLILRPNIISCLLGWDGLGLSSYLLVIFYSNNKAYNSGLITAITNRFGDILIIFSIAVFITNLNWRIGSTREHFNRKIWIWVLVLATFTKRAQVPFSAWLPAAIAAPTPVSSLVHSSTLVTAGVYLLIRFDSWFFNLRRLKYLAIVGMVTSFMASLNALFETDLKKIVALSTLSQLGLIVWFLRIGLPKISYVHLIAHAFFKAILFIGTGNMIHASRRGQDLRWIGGTSYSFRQTKGLVLLSNFRLMGLPFISAFFSKEVLLENLRIGQTNLLELIIFYLRVILTLVYSMRFLRFFYIFTPKIKRINFMKDSDFLTNIRIIILITPAIVGGKILLRFSFLSNSSISASLIYNLITGSLLSRLVVSSILWPFLKFVKKLFFIKRIISMWGLRIVSYFLGITSVLITPVLIVKKIDIGVQSKIIYSLILIPNLVFRLRFLNKSLKRFLTVILFWIAVSILYYLNNKL